MLDIYLRLQHGARPEPFAVSAKAMAQEKVIPGWGTRRIDAARRKLVEIGRFIRGIKVVKNAGPRPNSRLVPTPELRVLEKHPI